MLNRGGTAEIMPKKDAEGVLVRRYDIRRPLCELLGLESLITDEGAV